MSAITISDLSKTSTVFSAEIEKAKEGKKEVTNKQYGCLWVVGLVIVSCLASQNGLYGWGQGAVLVGMALLAVMYFAGDWALSTITEIFAPRWAAWILAIVAVSGLFLLSLTAGVSFMLSQQHAKDVETSRVTQLENLIAVNEQKFKEYGKTITADRITALQAELKQERERVGADHASSNAIYGYLAKEIGWSYESTSLLVRTIWILVFIITGMALSALKGMLWCPSKEKALCKSLERKFKLETKQLEREKLLAQDRKRAVEELGALLTSADEATQEEKRNVVGEREVLGKPQEMTFTEPVKFIEVEERQPTEKPIEWEKLKERSGARKRKAPHVPDPRNRRPAYEEVKTKVIEKEIRPTQRAFIRLGMGAPEASKYRQRMIDEGILQVVNQRGDCRVVNV